MSSPAWPSSVSGPGPPSRLSLRSVPRSVPPWRELASRVMPLVGSWIFSSSTTCSQLRMLPRLDVAGVGDAALAVVRVDVDRVVAGAAVDGLDRGAVVDPHDVVAVARVDAVGARVAVDLVVAGAGVDAVGARAAVDDVVAGAGGDLVGRGARVEVVVALGAVERVVAEAAERGVVAGLADEAVVAGAAVEHVVPARPESWSPPVSPKIWSGPALPITRSLPPPARTVLPLACLTVRRSAPGEPVRGRASAAAERTSTNRIRAAKKVGESILEGGHTTEDRQIGLCPTPGSGRRSNTCRGSALRLRPFAAVWRARTSRAARARRRSASASGAPRGPRRRARNGPRQRPRRRCARSRG